MQTPTSPAVLASQANSSPSKVSVPSRKQRNQQGNRVHDIEFATEISTSLLAQVRQLQALLAERDESLKAVNLEKSRLELEAEGYAQRIRVLDESEQRYKDENWSLETQTHELLAAAKEAAEKEDRLNSNLNAVTAEKTRYQRELDDLKQANGKLMEDYAANQKSHDSEIHVLRRTLNSGDTERLTLQQKVEELTSQNQELAKAVATKIRHQETDLPHDVDAEDDGNVADETTPESSPPPSPNKATPRHGHLESETLKSSLHHAHRMIQNLKSNIHREKSEKIELKRMLQDARDELDQRRDSNAPASANKRQKNKPDVFKKPARPEILGAGRRGHTEIVDEPDWEDQVDEPSPSRSGSSRYAASRSESVVETSDAYHTANETEDFETANEGDTATESDAFQTGAESLAGDSSDELTETESKPDRQSTLRKGGSRGKALANPGDRSSFVSTASTSADDEYYDDMQTQTPTQPKPPKYRLKMSRAAARGRSFIDTSGGSRPSSSQNSPSGFRSSRGSDVPAGQSLFAELGELNSADSDEEPATPSRPDAAFQASTPTSLGRPFVPGSNVPDVVMVDSGMMTDPWEPSKDVEQQPNSAPAAAVAVASEQQNGESLQPTPEPDSLPELVDSSTQYTPQKSVSSGSQAQMENFPTPPKTIWDQSAPDAYAKESSKDASSADVVEPPNELHMSEIFSQETEPVSPDLPKAQPQPVTEMTVSSIFSESTEPQTPPPVAVPSQTHAQLAVSSVYGEETIPVEADPIPVPSPSNPVIYTDASSGMEESLERPGTAVHAKETTEKAVQVEPQTKKSIPAIFVAEDETSQASRLDVDEKESEEMPLSNISGNVASRGLSDPKSTILSSVITSDQGAQTILSAEQIDRILTERASQSTTRLHNESGLSSPSTTPRAKPVTRVQDSETVRDASQLTTPTSKRPGSAGSQRVSPVPHPPLPSDHKEAIAAASRRLSQDASPGLMGPPIAPASAYRSSIHSRPRTPNDAIPAPGTRSGATSRSKARASSQLSQSSMSSFASELEQRFNMQPETDQSDPAADPRMIQAITQTMIGEFLWKYTRKPGRPEMSSTRHQRYFWVHPYTRTLYWSGQDPQSAGRSELRAKSVAIEAVRVITDDNPYPPGLHRKSLEIVTPGRKLRFTAATSQRHETWFNALSYLLLRTAEEDAEEEENNMNSGDMDDFNPSQRDTLSRTAMARMSLSSYHSRTTQNTSRHRASSGMSVRQSVTPSYAASTHNNNNNNTTRNSTLRPSQARQGSVSRLTSMFKNTSIRGSFASRYSGNSQSESIYDASVVEQDSAEELRQVIERQDQESDRLENVRACCDGKYPFPLLQRAWC